MNKLFGGHPSALNKNLRVRTKENLEETDPEKMPVFYYKNLRNSQFCISQREAGNFTIGLSDISMEAFNQIEVPPFPM